MDSPAKYIDHTLLKADSTALEIAALCEDAVEYDFASVCIPPAYVSQAQKLLYGSEVNVCTVIGFPLGYQKTEVKVFETSGAVESGADEVDMVINLGAARVADYALVEEDISRVVAASGAALVKVILECCLFADDVKQRLAAVAVAAGADFVKTSTGFAASGATVGDVKLLAAAVAGNAGVKAAGGIRDWKTCEVMLSAGANRVGTSAGVAIMRQWQRCAGLT
jgi:deoxyribose-phosphate aldolase